jgi:hypothetical protein
MKMSKLLVLVSIVAILLLTAVSLNARATLARDPNGTAIQFCRSYTCFADTLSGSDLPDSVAVPANTVQATIIMTGQAAWIRHGAVATSTGANCIYLAVGLPITIPVTGNAYIVWKNAAATKVGARINIIWQKM